MKEVRKMKRYKVKDLISKKTEELVTITRGIKNGKLYYGNDLICVNKDISKFYMSVLSYLKNDKGIEIQDVLGTTYNETGEKISKGSVMQVVPYTNIYVDTKSNNDAKYKKMLGCFEILGRREDIDLYEFEIDSNEKVKEEAGDENDMANEDVNEIISKAIANNKQVIFTGAPGTGKTCSVRKYVKNKCAILDEDGNKQKDKDGKLIVDEKQYKFVQFHPSYDYSDFVEGLRPVVLKDKEEPTFVRMDGVFKEFCRHIVEENSKGNSKDYYFIVDEINRADLAKVFGELMFGLEESYRGEGNLIQTQYKNLVTYRIIHKDDVDNTNIKNEDIGKAVPIENDVFNDGFYIPENLYFIGTMNDIDRSVESMDFALRRRFQWIDVKANDIMKSSLHSILDKDNTDKNSEIYKKIDALADKIVAMNKENISKNNKFGLSDAYHIGPAYFKKLDINDATSLKNVFDTNITSILREYTRGRKSEDVNIWIGKCREALLGEK